MDDDRPQDERPQDERPHDDRLAEVEQHIAEAREHAKEALEGPFHDENARLYADSGDEQGKREDDQSAEPM